MLKKPLFLETFLLLVTVGILNYIAVIYHLYWAVGEFDSVVHFFGGASISSFFLWFYFYSGFFNPQKRDLYKFLVIAILGAMTVAVFWEIFELMLGEASIKKSEYPFDTSLDLIMDFLGALGTCFYGYLKEIKWKI
jgi:hypothetical protein